jgi:hypothetical protein
MANLYLVTVNGTSYTSFAAVLADSKEEALERARKSGQMGIGAARAVDVPGGLIVINLPEPQLPVVP